MQSFIKNVIESQQMVSKMLTDAIQQVTGKQLNMVLLDVFPQKGENTSTATGSRYFHR